jgi:MFS transporter, DHA2 family, methylenomycin A resistance protein
VSARSRLVLLASTLGFSMVLLDTTVVNVALPAIHDDLGGSVAALQWVVNGYTLVFAALLLSMGTLADRFGPARVFVTGLGAFAAGSGLALLAPSLPMLVGAQLVLGVGAALVLPSSLSLISHAFPAPAERARAVGLWAAGSASAFALGPLLGGVLIDGLGWRFVFAINLPLAAAAAALVVAVGPRAATSRAAGRDLPGQLAALVGLVALTYAIIEGNDRGWGSAAVVGAFALAAVAAALLVAQERRAAHPVLPPALVAERGFAAATTTGLLLNFAFYGELFFLSLFLQQERGLSALETGLAFLPQPLLVMAVAPLAGRLVAERGARLPMAAGSLLGAVGALLLVGVDAHSSYGVLLPGLLLNGLGGGLAIPAVTAAVIGAARTGQAGVASAALNAGRQVGGVLGVAVLGAIATHGGGVAGMHAALAVAAGALALAGLLASATPRRAPAPAAAAAAPAR